MSFVFKIWDTYFLIISFVKNYNHKFINYIIIIKQIFSIIFHNLSFTLNKNTIYFLRSIKSFFTLNLSFLFLSYDKSNKKIESKNIN